MNNRDSRIEIPPELTSVPAVKRYIIKEQRNGKQKPETKDDQ